MPETLFLSHASSDYALAMAIVAAIESQPGHRCWIAPRDIPVGSDYPGSIVDAIRSCDRVALLLTETANQSAMVHREIERAASLKKPITVIKVTAVAPARELELFVSSSQWAEAQGVDAAAIAR